MLRLLRADDHRALLAPPPAPRTCGVHWRCLVLSGPHNAVSVLRERAEVADHLDDAEEARHVQATPAESGIKA